MFHAGEDIHFTVKDDGKVYGLVEVRDKLQWLRTIDLGDEGAELLAKIRALYCTKRGELEHGNVRRHEKLLRHGQTTWARMCATLDIPRDLPVGFRYATNTWYRAYPTLVVFYGFTAVCERDSNGEILVSWETQDPASPGWIGEFKYAKGRGHSIPSAECPVAVAFGECGADVGQVIDLLVTGILCDPPLGPVYTSFGLCEPHPWTQFAVCADGTLKKDGVAIRRFGGPLVADCILPKFFDSVRDNVEFWDAVQRACLMTYH